MLKDDRVKTGEHEAEDALESPSASDRVAAGSPRPARDLLARLPIPVAITRASDGVILFGNAELGRLHRTTVSRLIGRPIHELYMNLEDRQELLNLLARDGKVREFDLQTRRFGDGAPLWVSISVAPIHFEGEPALCATVVDITARKQAEQALRESEAQFRLLTENAQDLIFRYELLPYPHLSYVSPSATRLTGYTPEELYADPALAATFAHFGVLQDQDTQPGQGLTRPVELSVRHKDGSTVWFELRNVPIYDDQGKLTAFQGIARDITERKQTDERLRMYSRAMEQSPASILITNTRGEIEYVNPKFCQVTGYTPEEIKGKNPRILKSGRTSREEYRQLWETIAGGGEWRGEFHNKSKHGRYFWELASISPIFDANGVITHYLAVKEEITERKQRERDQAALLALATTLRLATSRAEVLKALLAQGAGVVPGSFALFATRDLETGRMVLEASNMTRRIQMRMDAWLQTVEDISARVLATGKPYWACDAPPRLVPARLRNIISLACLPLIAQEEAMGVLWLLSRSVFTPDEEQLLIALTDMAANALQRAMLHEQVARHAEELERQVALRTRELAAANERLQELDRLKSKFVSDVSHELRAPVANLMLYLNLLARRPEKQSQYLAVLHQQVARLDTLIRDILDLSRLEQQREPLRLTPVDLNVVIENVITAHQPRAETLGLDLRFAPAEGLPVVWGDPEKLVQVFTNLVANALNYTPAGSVEVLTYFDQEKYTVCGEVKDTGIGILPEDLPHIFDRFYRGKHDNLPPAPGTGLGLSIVKELVDLHGGAISVASQVGVGTTFTVTLPLKT